ncbi:MAG: Crp/Fnr family transcriptional regulator [Bacteroidetes bacterium]|nr:Crp/Fnr family transcriptional regulator [Bacteroidota bacterium]
MKKQDISCFECNIRYCSILKNCERKFLELIDKSKFCMTYGKGQIVIRQGSQIDGVYFISSGVAKVFVSGYRGRPLIVGLARAGSVLDHTTDELGKQQISVTTVEETSVCFIESKDYESICKESSGVREDLTKVYQRELNQMHARMVHLAQLNVREKTSEALLHIASAYLLEQSTEPFEVNLSRQDIGDLIGITKEQVSKNLADLKHEKVISVKGKTLQINDYKKLQDIVGL